MAANYPDERPEEDERRVLPRAATRRAATFNAPSGGAFLRGTVVDLSPNGLCIHTRQPLSAGSGIEIALAPRAETPGDEALLVRGTVVRMDAVDALVSAMGIQLRVHLPAGGGGPQLANRDAAAALLQRLSEDMRAAPDAGERAAGWNTAADDAAADDTAVSVDFRAVPPSRRWRWGVVLIVLLLLAGVAVWLVRGTLLGSDGLSGHGRSSAWRFTYNAADEAPSPEELHASMIEALPGALASSTTPMTGLEASAQLLDAAQPAAALEAYGVLAARADARPVERVRAHLGIAEVLSGAGREAEAQTAVDAAAGELDAVPGAWQRAVADWRRAVENETTHALQMTPRLDLSGTMDALGDATAGEGLRIEVSTEKYQLTVLDGGQVLGVYPVGLGFNDTTPAGQFTIANKIEDPDWFNRGNVIRADDPRNPLGSYWMGLGMGGRATSYGIHPTAAAESIGANASRGCIRMRPDDAASVFGWCRVGTPVLVGP